MNKFKFQADVIGELHPLFKGLQWVCAARSTDDGRFVLNLINVERDGLLVKIVATDGKRLHVHTFDPGMFDDDIQMIEPGLYEVIAKSGKLVVIAEPESVVSYPNWRQVMPDHQTTESDIVTASSIGKIGIRTGVLLAVDFTLDAIGFKHGRGKDESVNITYGPGPNKGGAFLIEHDLGTAVVMPLKMEDADKGEVEATPYMDGIPQPEPKPDKKAPQEADEGTPVMIPDEDEDGPRIVDVDAEEAGSAMDDEINSVLDRIPGMKHPLKVSAQLAHIETRYGLEGLNRMYQLAFEREGYSQKIIARIETAIGDHDEKENPEGAAADF